MKTFEFTFHYNDRPNIVVRVNAETRLLATSYVDSRIASRVGPTIQIGRVIIDAQNWTSQTIEEI